MSDPNTPENPTSTAANPFGFDSLLERFYNHVDSIPKKHRKAQFFIWFAVALVLVAAASFPIPEELRFIAAIVGTPAGILLFLLGLAVVRTTPLKTWSLFRVREIAVPQRRVIYVVSGLVVLAVSLFFLSTTLPFFPLGLGGAIAIIAALTAVNTLRRTPEELYYAQMGLRDPRIQDNELYDEEVQP